MEEAEEVWDIQAITLYRLCIAAWRFEAMPRGRLMAREVLELVQ